MFSIAVGTIGEWLKVVPFYVRGRTVDSWGGGGLAFIRAVSLKKNKFFRASPVFKKII